MSKSTQLVQIQTLAGAVENDSMGSSTVLDLFRGALVSLGRAGLLLAVLRRRLRAPEAVAEGVHLLAEGA